MVARPQPPPWTVAAYPATGRGNAVEHERIVEPSRRGGGRP